MRNTKIINVIHPSFYRQVRPKYQRFLKRALQYSVFYLIGPFYVSIRYNSRILQVTNSLQLHNMLQYATIIHDYVETHYQDTLKFLSFSLNKVNLDQHNSKDKDDFCCKRGILFVQICNQRCDIFCYKDNVINIFLLF